MPTTFFTIPPKKLNPNEDGRKMLALQVGESFVMPWRDSKRPQGPCETGFAGKVFNMEPTEAGVKITRTK